MTMQDAPFVGPTPPAGDGTGPNDGPAASGAPDDGVARGVRVGLAAYVLWGLLTIYWKQLHAFDALELIGWRMVCAAVVMALIVTARSSWPRLLAAFRDRATIGRLLLAATLLSVNWGSYLWAVVNDRVIETALGYFMAPLATMAIGVMVLGETPTKAQRLAFGLAAVAVVILSLSYGRPPWIALVIAGTWSFYGLTKRRISLDAIDSLAGETFVLIAPAIALVVVLAGRTDSVPASADARQWAFILGTGVITAVPLMLFASAAKAIPFTLLGPLNLIVPVINFGLGWVFYDESLPAVRIFGFAFVWMALLVVMWDRFKSSGNHVAIATS